MRCKLSATARSRAPLKLAVCDVAMPYEWAIRDRQVAAPLKQGWGVRTVGHVCVYPRPPGRGPIEAAFAAVFRSSLAAIRDRQVAAPLKHSNGYGLGPAIGLLSATARSRPH